MGNEVRRTVALRAGYPPPPAFIGLGFDVHGEGIVSHQFGILTSAETFRNYGVGSGQTWVDPEPDMIFVALSPGLLPQAQNIARFQRLSDIAVSAAL